jgi:hypothetical protein
VLAVSRTLRLDRVQNWGDFNTRAHAVSMFIFLIGAIVVKAVDHWDERDKGWFRVYTAVGALMIPGGILITATWIFDEHSIFALEAYEIACFAFYWIVQIVENWDEEGHRHRAGRGRTRRAG